MTDNLGDVLKELRNCVNLACDHKGPLKAASRIIELLEKDLKPSINRYSEAEKGNNDKAVGEIETALAAAKNAASAIRSYLKAEMEFRNINKGGTSENEASTHGALGDYKAAGRKGDSTQTHIEALIIQTQTTPTSYSEAELQLFEVGTYKNLRSRLPKGMELDHIPSKAALCEAACRHIEILTNKTLSKEERKKVLRVVERYGGAIAVPKEMHRRYSRTIGGKNTDKQITNDSLDLCAAISKDLDYYKEILEHHGLDATRIDMLYNELVNQLNNFTEEVWKHN
mgnify:FL=1